MISPEEITLLAKDAFGHNLSRVRQVNKATIRIELQNNVFIDIFQSLREPTKFAIHAKFLDERIYRLDDRPEKKYLKLKTYPWHFHQESEEHVVASPFSNKKRIAIIQFLDFVKKIIISSPPPPRNIS